MQRIDKVAGFIGVLTLACAMAVAAEPAEPAGNTLNLTLRKRATQDGAEQIVQTETQWNPQRTAVIICDMWDDHWCRGAAARVTELAPAMDRMVAKLRQQGALIIHAPSTCTDFYENSPARQHAQYAAFTATPIPLAESTRWGTCWCWPDPTREAELPIDDSDMGCDCETKCTIRNAWTRQIATLQIQDTDAITDNGQELYNLLAQHKIEHVAILGVHLNMCVLGRPFGIRQLAKLGVDVALVRDMTDTMYDHRRAPQVNHFAGTDLVVAHVERYWCPTFTSDQIIGGEPFQFAQQPEK